MFNMCCTILVLSLAIIYASAAPYDIVVPEESLPEASFIEKNDLDDLFEGSTQAFKGSTQAEKHATAALLQYRGNRASKGQMRVAKGLRKVSKGKRKVSKGKRKVHKLVVQGLPADLMSRLRLRRACRVVFVQASKQKAEFRKLRKNPKKYCAKLCLKADSLAAPKPPLAVKIARDCSKSCHFAVQRTVKAIQKRNKSKRNKVKNVRRSNNLKRNRRRKQHKFLRRLGSRKSSWVTNKFVGYVCQKFGMEEEELA